MVKGAKSTARNKQVKATVVCREAGFSIRRKRDGFIVQIRRKGISETKTFATLDAAKLHCQSLDTKRTNEGLSAFSLSPRQREEAHTAIELLGGRAGLIAAANAWLRANPPADALTVTQLFARHLADLESKRQRPKTILSRRQFLKRFEKDYGSRAASSITTDDVEQWLNTRIPEKTFNTMRCCLMAAFGFAVRRRLVEGDPVVGIAPKQFDRSEPHFWSAATVEKILRAAAARDLESREQQGKMKKPGKTWLAVTPYFALSAFGGLRPDEAARLDWANINLEESLIRIPAAASKVKKGRLVPMENNLVQWLMAYRKTDGPIAPSPITIKRARKAILVSSELPLKWPQDTLRHSFATHWMAVYAHEGRLAEMLGNSPAIVQKHYKGLTTKKEGEKYFAIVPNPKGEIIPFPKVAFG